MRAFERRAGQAYPYYKLASWDARSCVWRDGRKAFGSEGEARREARRPGRYRLSIVTEAGRNDLEPFEVSDAAGA